MPRFEAPVYHPEPTYCRHGGGLERTRDGLWFSTSSTRCGEREGPDLRVPFVPGAEDVEFVGRDLWTVSEAGAAPYPDPDEPTVPMLLRLDRRAVLAGSSTARC